MGDAGQPAWARRSLLLLASAQACYAPAGSGWMLAGAALAVLGIALRIYAKGSLQRDARVCTGGAFRFLRHPFYLASGLADLGLLVCSRAAIALPVWVYMHLVVARRRARREERQLAARFPEAWQAYAGRVPAIVPGLGAPATGDAAGFAWRRVVDEQEIHRSLRLAAGLAWLLGLEFLLAPAGPAGDGLAYALLALAASVRWGSHLLRRGHLAAHRDGDAPAGRAAVESNGCRGD